MTNLICKGRMQISGGLNQGVTDEGKRHKRTFGIDESMLS